VPLRKAYPWAAAVWKVKAAADVERMAAIAKEAYEFYRSPANGSVVYGRRLGVTDERLAELNAEAAEIQKRLTAVLAIRADGEAIFAGGRLVIETVDPTPATGFVAAGELAHDGHTGWAAVVAAASLLPVVGSKAAKAIRRAATAAKDAKVAAKEAAVARQHELYDIIERSGIESAAGKEALAEIKQLDALLKAPIASRFQDYLRQVENFTGVKLTESQAQRLQSAWQQHDKKLLSPEGYTKHVKQWERPGFRDKVIDEWERQTGQKWPVHTEDVLSPHGKPLRKQGQRVDAHHLIEKAYGGPHEWWNIHPARYPDIHQEKIHGKDGIVHELMPQRK
jgi:hypothetical protein